MNKFFEGLMIIVRNINEFLKVLFNAAFLTLGFLMIVDIVLPMLKMGLVQRMVWYITQIIKLTFVIATRQ